MAYGHCPRQPRQSIYMDLLVGGAKVPRVMVVIYELMDALVGRQTGFCAKYHIVWHLVMGFRPACPIVRGRSIFGFWQVPAFT